jgi:hypothetical protein
MKSNLEAAAAFDGARDFIRFFGNELKDVELEMLSFDMEPRPDRRIFDPALWEDFRGPRKIGRLHCSQDVVDLLSYMHVEEAAS